ncbi:hypothetical protein B296_00041526 [Ensete ventricosum]|uniref:GMPS ATP-PPase domain-containing protein n=1 Tax=Ensete ventricosum TaxID=4639 RepID=A0A426YGQ7_ENSVE|nr:hypothetical protein B296_00041526 [Ensete ventricosum]
METPVNSRTANGVATGGAGNLVLILDYGSQYTHLITRRIRQLSVLSLCISGTSTIDAIAKLKPRVVILSGGPHSVHAAGAPSFPDGFIEYAEEYGVFVLGICYGMQLLVQKLGGVVAVGEKQEYGKMEIAVPEGEWGLYGPEAIGGHQTVWMSHGDEAVKLPEGFTVVARSLQGSVAAIQNRSRRFYGLQYHPEVILESLLWFPSVCTYLVLIVKILVSYFYFGITRRRNCVTHSTQGMETLRHFLLDVCGVNADWKMQDVLEEEIKVIKDKVGPDEHVICALSGGVDSTVAATLVHKAIGDRLHCVFVDNGLLRSPVFLSIRAL